MTTRATRKTLLLSLSEQQAEALETALQVGAFAFVLDAEMRSRMARLARRGLLLPEGDSGWKLTMFGYAALTAYRAAGEAGLLREVA